MPEEFSVIGKRLPRPQAPAQATGTAQYAGDIKLPGMLIGKVLGSPYPHASIVSIDTSRAEKLPGVARVLTRKDVLPEKKFAGGLMNVPSSGKTILPEFIDRAIFNEQM